jgi:hypothetical protein
MSKVKEVVTASNQPPDCTEEVLLRLMMVEHLEPGLDDSLMTPEEKFVYANTTRYGGIARFRAAKTGASLLRFLFHDAGDFDNLETMDGKAIDKGKTGMDGCLHTFRDHKGATGSWDEKNAWKTKLEDDKNMGMNTGHNHRLASGPEFEALLRLHSMNDVGVPPSLSRAPNFWDKLKSGQILPRLTRPDAVTLAANTAMEAMYGFEVS